MIVIDASVLYLTLANPSTAGDADRALLEDDLCAPHLIDLEIASACRKRAAAGNITPQAARGILASMHRMPITRYPHGPLARIWALRQTVSVYDAAYVALAESLGCALVTADRRLATAPGIRCDVVLA